MKKPIVSHVGFCVNGKKQAVLTECAKNFEIVDKKGNVCFQGELRATGFDRAAGEEAWVADFSALREEGEYVLRADNGSETSFEIKKDVYQPVLFDTMKAFYYLRCGCELKPEHAGKFTHPACHTGKVVRWEDKEKYEGPERATVQEYEANGGWHDAGDYGRYVTAAACALAHLLFAYQLYPQVFGEMNLNIPESGGILPDVLAECRYEMEWLLKMQREDGAVYHKLTTAHHAPFIMPQEDVAQLYFLPVSTMATADFAAICALGSRIYRPFDAVFADRLLAAAKKTGEWLATNPEFIGFENPPGCGTGGYGEWTDKDNRFWAWTELYLATGEECYHERMKEAFKEEFPRAALGYGSVGGFGAFSYLKSDLPNRDADLAEVFRKAFLDEAERAKQITTESSYGVAMHAEEYFWGSNMNLMKRAMNFAIADTLCGAREYGQYVEQQVQCLLGCNPLDFCYVSGIGERSMKNPHLRPTFADGIDECIPGMVSGGPNGRPADEMAKKLVAPGTAPMKCYADYVGCYSLNEITIYWNSPTVFALAYLVK